MRLWSAVCLIVCLLPGFIPKPAEAAQTASCGVVEYITWPIDGNTFERDDFGLYRAPFQGRHAGVDMAFERYGEPVKAIARGRVTFSDPAGWDTEKGVVIIEHTMPDGTIAYSLYGHMEQIKTSVFPTVGQCVAPGEVVGAVGKPSRGAPHLHFEVRRREANAGGPGYSNVEPLQNGWLHPLDFIQRWQLRLKESARNLWSASGSPVSPPVILPDGSAIFGTETHIERRTTKDESLWRLDVSRLAGIVPLSDGRILGRTLDDQIIVVQDGTITGFWKADRTLQTPPFRIGNNILFVDADQKVVSYTPEGQTVWQAGPFGDHLEKAMVSGDLIALSTGYAGNFNLYVLNGEGKIIFQAAAPAPVVPAPVQPGGFYIMVGAQVGRLESDGRWRPLLDVGLALGRQAQIAVDNRGNTYIYPGFGGKLIAIAPDGKLRWQANLNGFSLQPPLLGIGRGCLLYVEMSDGVLSALRTADGQLRGTVSLYPGGGRAYTNARYLNVSSDDQVQFSAGYLTSAALDGLTLAGLKTCEE